MFATTEIARRIEAADVSLLRDALDGCGESAGAWSLEVHGGLGGYGGAGSPFNKLAGLGFEPPPADAAAGVPRFDEFEARCASSGVPAVVEFASLGDPAWLEILAGRGYRLVGVENVLGATLEPRAEDSRGRASGDGPRVRALEIGVDLEEWTEVLLDGFAAPDEQGVAAHEEFPRDQLRVAMRGLSGVRGFQPWLAELEDRTVGGGGLRLDGGVAHLCGAATLPPWRRRGVQRALVEARLEAARTGGCDLAVTVTQPGSSSQQNMQRFGFALCYVRNVLVREHAG